MINIIKESEAEISESVFDRVHHLDPTYTDNDMRKKMQIIIARFMTFRHRTLFYANHKMVKSDAQFRLHLMKDHYNLLVSAKKRANNCPEVIYVYADIYCRLKLKLTDESHKFFVSMEELNGILSNGSKYFFSLSYFIKKFVFDIFSSAAS